MHMLIVKSWLLHALAVLASRPLRMEENHKVVIHQQAASELQGGCGQTSFTLTLNGYPNTYELVGTSEGKNMEAPCNMGPFTTGNVVFMCQAGKWNVNMEACSPPPPPQGSCQKTNLKYSISGNSNVYELPAMADGSSLSRPCAMGPFTEGEVLFQCNGGEIGIRQTCSKPKAPGSCGTTDFTYTLNGNSNVYAVPELANSQKHVQDCNMGPFTAGSVTFTCQQGKLTVEDTCKDPSAPTLQEGVTATGGVAATPGACRGKLLFTFSLTDTDEGQTHSNTYELGDMLNGQEIHPQCAVGPFTVGELTFKCNEGQVSLLDHSCSKPVPEGSCPPTNFRYSIDSHSNLYQLPRLETGDEISRPCAMGPYTVGDVFFKCNKGELSIDKDKTTCSKKD